MGRLGERVTKANGRSGRELTLSVVSQSDDQSVIRLLDQLEHTTSGKDLRRERRAMEVTVVALAKASGITRQRVHQIEAQECVDDPAAARYRRALALLITEGGA